MAPTSRDRQILDAAAALFFEKGYGSVGVDEIGVMAGVTGPAVYRHFHGKDEILAALFDEAIDGVLRATGAASPLTGRGPVDSIATFVMGGLRSAAAGVVSLTVPVMDGGDGFVVVPDELVAATHAAKRAVVGGRVLGWLDPVAVDDSCSRRASSSQPIN